MSDLAPESTMTDDFDIDDGQDDGSAAIFDKISGEGSSAFSGGSDTSKAFDASGDGEKDIQEPADADKEHESAPPEDSEKDTSVADEDSRSAAPEEPEKASEGDEQRPASVDPMLVAHAMQLGMSREDIASLSTPAALQTAVRAAVRAAMIAGGQQRQQPQQPQAGAPQQQLPPQALPDSERKTFDAKLDESEYDPGLVKAFNGMRDHFQGEVQRLEAAVSQFVTQSQQRTGAESETRYDRWLANLGDEWEPTFGKGSSAELRARAQAGDQEAIRFYENRKSHSDELNRILAGAAAMGEQLQDEDALGRRALMSTFADEVKRHTRQEVRDQIRNQKGQFTSRPTARKKTVAATPEQAAADAVGKFLEKAGITAEDDSEYFGEGLSI